MWFLLTAAVVLLLMLQISYISFSLSLFLSLSLIHTLCLFECQLGRVSVGNHNSELGFNLIKYVGLELS